MIRRWSTLVCWRSLFAWLWSDPWCCTMLPSPETSSTMGLVWPEKSTLKLFNIFNVFCWQAWRRCLPSPCWSAFRLCLSFSTWSSLSEIMSLWKSNIFSKVLMYSNAGPGTLPGNIVLQRPWTARIPHSISSRSLNYFLYSFCVSMITLFLRFSTSSCKSSKTLCMLSMTAALSDLICSRVCWICFIIWTNSWSRSTIDCRSICVW